MTSGRAAEHRALLELEALLRQVQTLRDDGDADRFTEDDHYRWVLDRRWIAIGNEAYAYAATRHMPVRQQPLWANLYDLRNHLAHSRRPDIDEAMVRHFNWSRTDSILHAVQEPLRPGGAARHAAARAVRKQSARISRTGLDAPLSPTSILPSKCPLTCAFVNSQ